jgi:hypothetical protein
VRRSNTSKVIFARGMWGLQVLYLPPTIYFTLALALVSIPTDSARPSVLAPPCRPPQSNVRLGLGEVSLSTAAKLRLTAPQPVRRIAATRKPLRAQGAPVRRAFAEDRLLLATKGHSPREIQRKDPKVTATSNWWSAVRVGSYRVAESKLAFRVGCRSRSGSRVSPTATAKSG